MSNSLNLRPDGTLVIVSGPSGAGKSTLVDRICRYFASYGNEIHFSVSHTTRPPRAGEIDGVNYHFVSTERFAAMREAGEFLESAFVHANWYGTARSEVEARLNAGQDVVLDIDVQGARLVSAIDTLRARAVSVLVFPPAFSDLRARLEARGLNTGEEIEGRLGKARDELLEGLSFYDYVIINDDVDVATDCLKAVVIATKLKKAETRDRLREMAARFKEITNA